MTVENSPAVFVNGVRAQRLNFDEVADDNVTSKSSQRNAKGAEHSMDVDIVPVGTSNKLIQHELVSDMAVLDNSKEGLSNPQGSLHNQDKGAGKQLKRKRSHLDCDGNSFDKEALMAKCQQELDELHLYYKEFSGLKVPFEDGTSSSFNGMVASLLEERTASFSKLVSDIFERIKEKDGVTLVSVRAAVLSVGQRMMYGISSADTDVLEDESEPCLWCWETRDLKLLPASLRGTVNVRRTARKMIHKRISVVSEALSALSSEGLTACKSNLVKISVKLGKSLNKEAISSSVEKMNQKNSVEIALKEAKSKEKETEKSNRNAEKEKQKLDRDLQKEKLRNEKELKRLQDESRRDEKRREKEEIELQKQFKKQQEEAFREQQRREKEEAEQKKHLAIQKQASIMERFLKSKKNVSNAENCEKVLPFKQSLPEKSPEAEVLIDTATTSMDCAFSQQSALSVEEHRSHFARWYKSASCNRSCHWGIRQKPKTKLVTELKLQKPSLGTDTILNKESSANKANNDSDPTDDRLDDDLEESFLGNAMSCHNNPVVAPAPVQVLNKKLLQFDKSFRPAYYGTWQKKSNVVGPRNPLKKDPELDYEFESDEEWEEEDPGESLSDCDKDNEESLDEEIMRNKDDDNESVDSFFVPDGYLSENEGVEVEMSSDPINDEANFLPPSSLEDVSEEFQALLRLQKLLSKWTEKALRKTQPLVISNLNHEKTELLSSEDLSGTAKIEQACLQALCMRMCSTVVIDLPTSRIIEYDHQEVCQSSKENSAQATPTSLISDSDLSEFVRSIQSCPYGINKVVEVLRQKFPAMSKVALRKKVREISSFTDNHWQVNKQILEKLGLHSAPAIDDKGGNLKGTDKGGNLKGSDNGGNLKGSDKGGNLKGIEKSRNLKSGVDKGGKCKGIASYFSKRCLPPARDTIKISETTPEKCCISVADCNFPDDLPGGISS